jgi:hypothetical protein
MVRKTSLLPLEVNNLPLEDDDHSLGTYSSAKHVSKIASYRCSQLCCGLLLLNVL